MLQTIAEPTRPNNTLRYVNETFTDEVFHIDGNSYVRCKFIRCRIIFSGEFGVSFKECSFVDCDWGFAGPAANTLRYLSALYQGLGHSGEDMVESIFGSIRNGIGRSGELLSFPSEAK